MIDSIIEMIKLLSLMIFVSSIGAQGWIAFLDITKYFTNKLEKYRPLPSQDKYSRIAIIIGVFVILMD
ncbi:MAG: hypothetical protein OQK48_07690 [Sulfurimonas sp.]|uniref:hypothetical protein n=1 Tax=Sulfurimonas sp. TaxID=2022749 RepID=UPI0026399D56|nr:hypothetical protein [Sulfurimonas sp.]MCW8894907.1 hypothetical protein [Sulfurimonas sp.]MCW8954814.1 hypothetical protein [Sulfurimonas sp.]MCW9068187.1 hypothetical protein [Sulfurimonas sp.]